MTSTKLVAHAEIKRSGIAVKTAIRAGNNPHGR